MSNTIRQALELEAAAGLNGFGRPAGYEYHFTVFDQFHQEAAKINPHGYRYNHETYVPFDERRYPVSLKKAVKRLLKSFRRPDFVVAK
ncbi:MAG TPA: hypothetical protein VI390_00655 [Methyloceanibacter sp.]